MEQHHSVRFTIVGLGQCGSQIAASFAALGYPAVVVNTSYTDLAAVPHVPEAARVYVGLHGRDGTGKDTSLGEYSLRESAEVVRAAVQVAASRSDALLLCGGLGGGTGGCLAALADLLEPLALPKLAAFVTPGGAEPGPVKVNAVRAADRLFAAPLDGLVALDADRLVNELGGDPLGAGFARALDAFNALGARSELHSIRSFDGEDLRRVLFAGRFVTLGSEALAVPLDARNIASTFRALTAGAGPLLGGHLRAAASFAALTLIVPQRALEGADGRLFESAIAEARDELDGAALYVGLYVTEADDAPRLLAMASGMPIPDELHQLSARAREEGQEFKKKLEAPVARLDVRGLDGLSLFGKSFRAGRFRREAPSGT